MLSSLDRKRTIRAIGVGAILAACFAVAGVVSSSEARLPPGFPSVGGGPTSFRTEKLYLPLDQLLAHPDVFVAVVEPLERGPVYVVPLERRGEFGITVDDTAYPGDWPFTPVTVRVAEAVKGELPATIVVWEERGELAGYRVDSSDPYLRPGEKGLLILGKHGNRWLPIAFAPVAEDGRIPSLGTTIEELRQRNR